MIEAERMFTARDTLADGLAKDVADELWRAIQDKGKATLAVSGGSTPTLFFDRLSEADLPWHRVTVTLVDERQVPDTSDRSNAKLVRQHLLKNKAAAANFEPPYHSGAAEKLPPFDVAVLGMGNDGHTASYFPGGDSLSEALDQDTTKRLIAITAPGAGEPRVTFTLPSLMQAGRLKLHIEGADKKRVLDQALGEGPEADMPVRAVLRGATPVTLYWSP